MWVGYKGPFGKLHWRPEKGARSPEEQKAGGSFGGAGAEQQSGPQERRLREQELCVGGGGRGRVSCPHHPSVGASEELVAAASRSSYSFLGPRLQRRRALLSRISV